MPLNTPRDLFMYELSQQHDAEKKSGQLLSQLAGEVRDKDLKQMLQAEEQTCQRKMSNIDKCFQSMGSQPMDVNCAAIDGVRTEYQEFMAQQPSPEATQMYANGVALRMSHVGTANYKGLADKSVMMGDAQCGQSLQTNRVLAEQSAATFERIGHEMGERMMARA